MFVFSRFSFKFSIFLKVAIATQNFMNEVYQCGFAPEFSVSILKEISALGQSFVYETRKKVKTRGKIYGNLKMKSLSNETLERKF